MLEQERRRRSARGSSTHLSNTPGLLGFLSLTTAASFLSSSTASEAGAASASTAGVSSATTGAVSKGLAASTAAHDEGQASTSQRESLNWQGEQERANAPVSSTTGADAGASLIGSAVSAVGEVGFDCKREITRESAILLRRSEGGCCSSAPAPARGDETSTRRCSLNDGERLDEAARTHPGCASSSCPWAPTNGSLVPHARSPARHC